MQILYSYLISLIIGTLTLCLGVYQLVQCDFSITTGYGIARILLSLSLCFIGLFIGLSQLFISILPIKKRWKMIPLETDYCGPIIKDKIDANYAYQLYSFFKEGNGKGLLCKRDVFRIVEEANVLLQNKDGLVKVTIEPNEHITVVGDLHGQFYDLCNLFQQNGLPSATNKYIFNGDLVDRGVFGIEIVLTLYSFLIAFPQSLFINRGNHETYDVNYSYGFLTEVQSKYDQETFIEVAGSLRWLPYCHLINNSVFIVHGGLPPTPLEIDKINQLQRGDDPEDGSIESELLWNDPQAAKGNSPSYRGIGHVFGPDVTQEFLNLNHLDLIIRSHEMKMNGYEWNIENKLMTIFSAPNYCGTVGNKGAYVLLSFDENTKPITKIIQFDSVIAPHITLSKEPKLHEFEDIEIDVETVWNNVAPLLACAFSLFAIINEL
ncbi:serine/threonine protein phosphatase, putative [Entamoeba histolytica HM-1:IMSS-B]|uniref:Serine/threonine-protein phosphatase n=6 Tax=Entamoeba histolytica TaxID=5759 RepID=C4M672_ENTH1|nr:serine/threonine protein phosphatase, putative [Entamoeba histolytica HM-1:IMSS]EMD49793.1 serine/threonine protein phosphatase, putative [Entamoeba histolytica KU27]EMH72811.1 serine/threonine protein phosphatase, putative [Entamoeba histolytica HM-1:IMSS-B]EMS14421.1 serine/threonine protein phosphatase, putative [Entamoeba histolytica HM-3:IMSS]ENY61689.1 serine/threonine protein phosphatase, putative [Entamoeba histolytica HM-1:IMSS-A]GAT96957.1 serine threonine protein phosphatase puta|eukprot:XP_651593.1 serine/threonine protein phosphatase, putative [Entamoeba histolytica HM-1:IMSS]